MFDHIAPKKVSNSYFFSYPNFFGNDHTKITKDLTMEFLIA